MFLVVYADRGLVSSGLNMKLYHTLFSLTWIISILWNCLNNLEPFHDTWNLINLIVVFSIDSIIVKLLIMNMRTAIGRMCLSRSSFSSIGGTKRRNLFTAEECRHSMHILQIFIILEEVLLLGLPVSKEAVQSVVTLGWCVFLSLCIPLRLLYILNRDPPLLYIHQRKLSYFTNTPQVFTPRAATIGQPKLLNRNNEEYITPGCSIFFEKPQFRSPTEIVIFAKQCTEGSSLPSELEGYNKDGKADKTDMEGPKSSPKKMSHQERSKTHVHYLSLDVHELENLQKNQEAYDYGNMMRRLELKTENSRREFSCPPKIIGIPDVCID